MWVVRRELAGRVPPRALKRALRELGQPPDAAARAYPSLRFIAYGASPIAEGTLRRAMATFKCEFLQAYGMTELASIMPRCQHMRYHRPPSLIWLLLDEAGERLLGPEDGEDGVVTGRFAFRESARATGSR